MWNCKYVFNERSIIFPPEGGYERVRVSTPHCALEVARELAGPSSSGGGPVLVTLADLGLNHLTNYSKLLASPR